jgi:hypothetical protein
MREGDEYDHEKKISAPSDAPCKSSQDPAEYREGAIELHSSISLKPSES